MSTDTAPQTGQQSEAREAVEAGALMVFMAACLGGLGIVLAAVAVGAERAWNGRERGTADAVARSWRNTVADHRAWLAMDRQRSAAYRQARRAWWANGAQGDPPARPARSARLGGWLRRSWARTAVAGDWSGRFGGRFWLGFRDGWATAREAYRGGADWREAARTRPSGEASDLGKPVAEVDDKPGVESIDEPQVATVSDQDPQEPAKNTQTETEPANEPPSGENMPTPTVPTFAAGSLTPDMSVWGGYGTCAHPAEPGQQRNEHGFCPGEICRHEPHGGGPESVLCCYHSVAQQRGAATTSHDATTPEQTRAHEEPDMTAPTATAPQATETHLDHAIMGLGAIQGSVARINELNDQTAAAANTLAAQVAAERERLGDKGTAAALQALDEADAMVTEMRGQVAATADAATQVHDQAQAAIAGLQPAANAQDELHNAGATGELVSAATSD